MKYRLYQVDSSTNRGTELLFLSSESMKKLGLWPISEKDYKLIHEDEIVTPEQYGEKVILEAIFRKHQGMQPQTFRSITVSDVVVLETGRGHEAWICEPFTWTKLPDFLEEGQ